jgi:dipeptidyl aminopeptidase/acylaminoacyl peptidase
MPSPKRLIQAVLSLALLLVLNAPAVAQDVNASIENAKELLAKETYVRPPDVITKLVTAPWHLSVSLTQPSPDRRFFLKEQRDGLPTVNAFGKPHLYFGGLQVDPAAIAPGANHAEPPALSLVDATTGASTTIETPKGATVSATSWSPDGKQLAPRQLRDCDACSWPTSRRKSTQVTKTPLLATLVTAVDWTVDGKNLLVVLVPEPRAPQPVKPVVATGPRVQVWTEGKASPQRNFFSLLEEPYDAALMEWYVTGQLAVIDVKTKAVRKVGSPAMIQSADASPDGQYFRVATMQKPFSYIVQYQSFGVNDELWDATGKVVATVNKRHCAKRPTERHRVAGSGEGAARDRVAPWPGCLRARRITSADAPVAAIRRGTGRWRAAGGGCGALGATTS